MRRVSSDSESFVWLKYKPVYWFVDFMIYVLKIHCLLHKTSFLLYFYWKDSLITLCSFILFQRFSPQSGYWSGSFILYGKTHGFKFILKCKNGIIKGRGVDNIDACKIRGKWNSNDGRVKFIKHYNDEKNYKVNYSGKLSPDSRTMSGQYKVETRSGTFTMSLSPSDENL